MGGHFRGRMRALDRGQIWGTHSPCHLRWAGHRSCLRSHLPCLPADFSPPQVPAQAVTHPPLLAMAGLYSSPSTQSSPSGLPLAGVHQVWGSLSSPITSSPGPAPCSCDLSLTYATRTPRTVSRPQSLLRLDYPMCSWAWPPLYSIGRPHSISQSEIVRPQRQLRRHPHHCEPSVAWARDLGVNQRSTLLLSAPPPPSRQPRSPVCSPH